MGSCQLFNSFYNKNKKFILKNGISIMEEEINEFDKLEGYIQNPERGLTKLKYINLNIPYNAIIGITVLKNSNSAVSVLECAKEFTSGYNIPVDGFRLYKSRGNTYVTTDYEFSIADGISAITTLALDVINPSSSEGIYGNFKIKDIYYYLPL